MAVGATGTGRGFVDSDLMGAHDSPAAERKGDYRQLVHELDQHQYCELRVVVLEIRNTYAVLYDIINKNYDKIKKPRGDCKALIY